MVGATVDRVFPWRGRDSVTTRVHWSEARRPDRLAWIRGNVDDGLRILHSPLVDESSTVDKSIVVVMRSINPEDAEGQLLE